MNSDTISKQLYTALKLKYESVIAETKSTLFIYFSNPVAIGEHPQHLEEMDKLLETMASASDKLEMLEKNLQEFK